MLNDYIVRYISEREIAKFANEVRERANVAPLMRIDIVDIIYRLTEVTLKNKGKLSIRKLSDGEEPYVKFNPLRLYVSSATLEEARLGNPEEIYKLAHELGHILLHDHYALNFSKADAERLKSVQKEETAEWQAHAFARHFLAPDSIVKSLPSPNLVAQHCNIPKIVAQERYREVFGNRSFYEGEPCPVCQNFTLVRKGVDLNCDTCRRD